jgi:hypothetical protein
MTQAFDEIMKRLEANGTITNKEAEKLIAEHGPLTDEEKKRLAEALMKATPKSEKAESAEKSQTPDAKEGAEATPDEKEPDEDAEVTMEEYLTALATLDSTDVTDEEKARASRVRERFESQ